MENQLAMIDGRSSASVWEEFYEKCASLSDPISQTAKFNIAPVQYKAICEDVSAKLQLSASSSVVDIGCGNGLIDAFLAPRCLKITGLDLSKSELEHARRNTSHMKNVQFFQANACSLPLADDFADRVVSYSATMHFEKDLLAKSISEMVRVCRPGGLILIGDIVNKERWEECRTNRGQLQKLREYCAMNPDGLSMIPLRVLTFNCKKHIQLLSRKLLNPQLRLVEPVGKPISSATYEESELLGMAECLGQQGRVLKQNFRLPYARYRYDLLLEVRK